MDMGSGFQYGFDNRRNSQKNSAYYSEHKITSLNISESGFVRVRATSEELCV